MCTELPDVLRAWGTMHTGHGACTLDGPRGGHFPSETPIPVSSPATPTALDAQTRARSSHPEHDTAPHVDGQEAFKTQYGCNQESRKRAGFCKGGYEISSVIRNDFC